MNNQLIQYQLADDVDAEHVIIEFYRLCHRQVNYLYGTIHFDNTRDDSYFPAEFEQLDRHVHRFVEYLNLSLNEVDGFEDGSNVREYHNYDFDNILS